jgi:hypothetical protein
MDGGAASEIELASGAAIELRNSATGPRDRHDGDFLLHYEVFERVPPTRVIRPRRRIAPAFKRCRSPTSSWGRAVRIRTIRKRLLPRLVSSRGNPA